VARALLASDNYPPQMPPEVEADLEQAARLVLERNRRPLWTCPSTRLYPHQWLWDSCFIAIGVARYDPSRAAGELNALFRGQWSNGMLPHIIFDESVKDIGSRRIWRSRRNPLAPRDVDTSCVTQPPLPAIAVHRVAQTLPAVQREAFLRDLFPKLIAYHQWLYDERDPHDSGLVTLIHPWECGLDTTPPWMQSLAQMSLPWWLRIISRLHLARAVRMLRTDTRYIPAAERPSDDDGLRMLVLATRAKKHQFKLDQMPRQGSVLIEDLAFNAIFAAANRSLELVAQDLDVALPPPLQQKMQQTDAAFEQLWDEASGQYYSRNATTQQPIKVPTVATFLPLWSGIPSPARAEQLVALLRTATRFWPQYPVPSVSVDAPEFRESGYWKGPTWVNMNWMIEEGLRNYEHVDLAEELRLLTLQFVERAGFSEYFSPHTGQGYGADDFSWTAALVIDLLARA
jgi:hypothetical protein